MSGDKESTSGSLFSRVGEFLGKRRPWYDLPALLAVPKLIQMRDGLREKNLHDTEDPPLARRDSNEPPDPKVVGARTVDGTFNDLNYPKMGSAGCPFGRNFPLEKTFPDVSNLLEPNPREVSLALMTRKEFQSIPFLNLLAASWIQFMVHDWFVHETSESEKVEIPIRDDDSWAEKPMRIAKTQPRPAPAGSNRPPAYNNKNSHWWDGSQVYGCETETCGKLRTGIDGKLKIGTSGRLLTDPETGLELTGFTDNSWIGLSMLHALFTLEHNAICDMLKGNHPGWDDEQIHGKARLINAAVMAKIHTLEWTCAILPHPLIQMGMRTNWYGLSGEDIQDVLEFLDESEYLGGIIGSHADHHSAPYSLTEEFVSVYRMHPLMPDEFTLRSVQTNDEVGRFELPDLAGKAGVKILENFSMADLFYSFGQMHPGQIRLHNYPRHLQSLNRDDGTRFDLAAVDILRDRERGVPRYNEFRRLLRKEPVKSFEELTDVPEWVEEIRRVYNNDIEKVDVMVGLLAEPLPEGFGFSETAFRIFLLMASRRLKSDRFFTDDFRPEVYTEEGIDWVRNNGFASVLKRHYPELGATLEGLENPFNPWKAAAAVTGSRGASA
jgi:hypothetical protein